MIYPTEFELQRMTEQWGPACSSAGPVIGIVRQSGCFVLHKGKTLRNQRENAGRKITGLKHLWVALRYSIAGLFTAFRGETAFRHEILLTCVLVPTALLLPLPLVSKALMLASVLLLLIIELLNSAIEAVVDLTTPDKHPLAKHAKDMGSAAVLLCLINMGVIWVLCLLDRYGSIWQSAVLP